jgi:hypothetical protein
LATPMLFNRRLREEEIASWLDLLENHTRSGFVSQEMASTFLRLPETIAFVSTIEDRIIGGTAIFRDKIRLGMVLCSVSIHPSYRESSAFHVIKTSLPFMKTVAIRDVDALIADESNEAGIGFPASLELDAWMFNVLEKVGFQQVGTIGSYTLEYESQITPASKERIWDNETNLEGMKQLVWSQSKSAGLTTSLVWAAIELAAKRGKLRTYTVNGMTRVVTIIDRLDDAALVEILFIDPDFSDDFALNSIIADISGERTRRLYLPLVGEGQKHLVNLFAEKMEAGQQRRSLKLLRKNL